MVAGGRGKGSCREQEKMVSRYVKALALTTAVFLVGIFIGFMMEGFVASDIGSQATSIGTSVQELELEMLYLQGVNKSESCPVMNDIIEKTNSAIYSLSNELTQYSDKNVLFEKENVLDVKKRYTLYLIKNWILQKRVKEECGLKAPIILYFYEREECNDCIIQGNILTLFNERLGDEVIIFPLDRGIDSPMLALLVNKYGIDQVPSLVIDDVVHKGLVSKDDLKAMVCPSIGEACSDL